VIVSRFGPQLKLKANNMKRQKVFSLALLLIEVAFTLFIAGIVVPSLLRPELATKEALAPGSLRAINVAGFAFSYTTQSVEFAILQLSGRLGGFRYPFSRRCTRKHNLCKKNHSARCAIAALRLL